MVAATVCRQHHPATIATTCPQQNKDQLTRRDAVNRLGVIYGAFSPRTWWKWPCRRVEVSDFDFLTFLCVESKGCLEEGLSTWKVVGFFVCDANWYSCQLHVWRHIRWRRRCLSWEGDGSPLGGHVMYDICCLVLRGHLFSFIWIVSLFTLECLPNDSPVTYFLLTHPNSAWPSYSNTTQGLLNRPEGSSLEGYIINFLSKFNGQSLRNPVPRKVRHLSCQLPFFYCSVTFWWETLTG